MALKASLSVLLGCSFGPASRLLGAAERGDEGVVQQVLSDRPQLAAFTGFHGTSSALHRAAAAGHLGVCRAIIEPLKQRARLAEAAGGGKRSVAAAKWQRLVSTVLNQRSHKSMTPLMLACEHGHAAVAAYLLREGADPLAADFVHSRTCLHYAAVGGHADCLRLLCSDSALVSTPDGMRPLRDVIVSDMQVQACRFIDQRAFGGLTALHFAVVTGSLDAVQALLRGGASIMVKSDGEAYIGEDFLVPGSSPLHVAVIINNISIVHAILQAHMEMMNILGTSLDERGRRPWEGTSRTDIRSVRNHFRKLPFHLARERHQPQLMSLVDPRIPVDVALDAARDTEHGIGPKRLSTICSLVLQRSLLQWLDNCQRELAREAAGKPPRPRDSEGHGRGGIKAKSRLGGPPAPAVDSSSPPPTAAGARPAPPSPCQPTSTAAAGAAPSPQQQAAAAAAAVGGEAGGVSPFAVVAGGVPSAPPSPRASIFLPGASASAPATPARTPEVAGDQAGPATVGAVPTLEAQGSGMASLHGYMGMLSIKRPPSVAALEGAGGAATVRSLTRQLSGSVPAHQLLRNSSGAAGVARVRFLTDPTGAADAAALAAAGGALTSAADGSPDSIPESPRVLAAAASPREPDRTITVVPAQHRRSSSQGNVRLGVTMGGMFGVRRRSQEGGSAAATPASASGGTAPPVVAAAVAAVLSGTGDQAVVLASDKEKDLGLDSEGEPDSPLSKEEEDGEDVECGVCLDALVEVAFASCQHKLCLACARNLTQQNKKPPHCPFCRRLVVGFQRVSATGVVPRDGSSPRAGPTRQPTP